MKLYDFVTIKRKDVYIVGPHHLHSINDLHTADKSLARRVIKDTELAKRYRQSTAWVQRLKQLLIFLIKDK